MSRPQPKILQTFPNGHWTQEIIEAEQCIYAVAYKNKLVGRRQTSQLSDRKLYPNHMSNHRAHIERAVKELNELSATTDYSVAVLTWKPE